MTRPSKSVAKSRSPDATGASAAGAGRVAVHRVATGSNAEGVGGGAGTDVRGCADAAAAPGSREAVRMAAEAHLIDVFIGGLQDMVVYRWTYAIIIGVDWPGFRALPASEGFGAGSFSNTSRIIRSPACPIRRFSCSTSARSTPS